MGLFTNGLRSTFSRVFAVSLITLLAQASLESPAQADAEGDPQYLCPALQRRQDDLNSQINDLNGKIAFWNCSAGFSLDPDCRQAKSDRDAKQNTIGQLALEMQRKGCCQGESCSAPSSGSGSSGTSQQSSTKSDNASASGGSGKKPFVGSSGGGATGVTCFYAGWPLVTDSSGNCPEPTDNQNYTSLNCSDLSTDKAKCNPDVFGLVSSKAFCVPKSPVKNTTKACGALATGAAGNSDYKAANDTSTDGFKDVASTVDKACKDAKAPADCDVVKGQVAGVKNLAASQPAPASPTANKEGGSGANGDGAGSTNAKDKSTSAQTGAQTSQKDGKTTTPAEDNKGLYSMDGSTSTGDTNKDIKVNKTDEVIATAQTDANGKTISAQSADGKTSVNYDDKGNVVSGTSEAKAVKNTDYDRDAAAQASSDHCHHSATIDGKYECDSTYSVIEGSKIVNQVGQLAGSTATNFAGQSALQNSAQKGTMGSYYEGAAQAEKAAGIADLGVAGVNAAMGIWQFKKASHHANARDEIKAGVGLASPSARKTSSNLALDDITSTAADRAAAKEAATPPTADPATSKDATRILELKKGYGRGGSAGDAEFHAATATGKGSITEKIIANFNVNNDSTVQGEVGRRYKSEMANDKRSAAARATDIKSVGIENNLEQQARDSAYDDKARRVAKDVQILGGKAAGEQDATRKAAMAGGMMSTILALQQGINGGSMLMRAAADAKLGNTLDQPQNGYNYQPNPNEVGTGDTFANHGTTSLAGNGTNPDGSPATADNPAPTAKDNLGVGIPGPMASNEPLPGGPPGTFKDGATPGQGGGGVGSVGSQDTSPASGSTDDPQARLASNGGNDRYESGGGGYSGGGGGGGGADKGPDLSGMLAQFLPKKDEDGKNNILDYGGRNPASEGPISLLDKNVNIFERVHETYQDKHKHGRIGG